MQDLHAVTLGGRSRVTPMHSLHPHAEVMQTVHRRDCSGAPEGHDMQDLHGASPLTDDPSRIVPRDERGGRVIGQRLRTRATAIAARSAGSGSSPRLGGVVDSGVRGP